MKKYSKTEQRERSKRLEYFEGLFLSVLAFENETGKITFPNGNCNELEQNKIRWVIQGGESGIRKREFKTEWAYFLKTQCKNSGVPYFFKQIDKVRPIPPDLLIREKPF